MLQELQTACQEFNLKPIEVALSWLVNHSLLDDAQGDGIILGASISSRRGSCGVSLSCARKTRSNSAMENNASRALI